MSYLLLFTILSFLIPPIHTNDNCIIRLPGSYAAYRVNVAYRSRQISSVEGLSEDACVKSCEENVDCGFVFFRKYSSDICYQFGMKKGVVWMHGGEDALFVKLPSSVCSQSVSGIENEKKKTFKFEQIDKEVTFNHYNSSVIYLQYN